MISAQLFTAVIDLAQARRDRGEFEPVPLSACRSLDCGGKRLRRPCALIPGAVSRAIFAHVERHCGQIFLNAAISNFGHTRPTHAKIRIAKT